MADLKLKTRNIRRVANQIEKNAKAGLSFNLMQGWADGQNMGCIGAVAEKIIRDDKKLSRSKLYKPTPYFSYENALTLFTGIPHIKIGVPTSPVWKRYHSELQKIEESTYITAKQAVVMLRNLASGKWTVE